MDAAPIELTVTMQCGHRVTVHRGPSYAVNFTRLPRTIAELEAAHVCRPAAARQ